MSVSIPEVANTSVRSCILIDITVDTETYYISTSFNTITYNGNIYGGMGSFLSVSSMNEDLKSNNGDISIGLSGIAQAVIYSVLEATIKGGEVIIYRAFFDDDLTVSNVYQRFKGVITNYAITEDFNPIKGELTNTVALTCSSINSILDNRITGQRTNASDRELFYPGDTSFNRIVDLHNVSFDFGRPMGASGGVGRTAGSGSTSGNTYGEPSDADIMEIMRTSY